MNKSEMIPNEKQVVNQDRDYLKDAERALGYLEDHPGIGVLAGGTLTASGIGALVYYGCKIIKAS